VKKASFILLAVVLLLPAVMSGCNSHPADPSGEDGSKANPPPAGVQSEVIINPGEWELTGTLTLPDGEGPFPLVVFIHGSGPADRDETIGKIKVFRDLAAYLAGRKVASLRYDKRTYLYGEKMADDYNLTVTEETVEDVLRAVSFAMASERVDARNIFVVGHSMGGYLIPKINEADSENSIAGYVSLAGSARSIMELMLEQVDYILSLETSMSDSEKAAYKKQIEDADKIIKGFTEADKGTNQMVLGAYPAYWLDLADYNPTEQIKDVKKPLLFLQGGNDYQVTTVDFDMWKAALSGNKKAAFLLYPKLTHSFTFSENKGTPGDYQTFAKVDEAVADDIQNFIKNNRR